MKINRYWHELRSQFEHDDKTYDLIAWGGSPHSNDDAIRCAETKLGRIMSHLTGRSSQWDYDYRNTEIREPIVKEPAGNLDDPSWIITRNRYGALVLNASDVAFIDIDCASGGCLLPFLGESKKKRLEKIHRAIEQSHIEAHIYETFGGYRVLVTNQLLPPTSDEAIELQNLLSADKLYAKLCRKHECYRARLTPKPYRMGMVQPVVTTANVSSDEVSNWLAEYTDKSKQYSVCRLVSESRYRPRDQIIDEIKRIHDDHCLGGSLPLA